jgi:hypothetical protein
MQKRGFYYRNRRLVLYWWVKREGERETHLEAEGEVRCEEKTLTCEHNPIVRCSMACRA